MCRVQTCNCGGFVGVMSAGYVFEFYIAASRSSVLARLQIICTTTTTIHFEYDYLASFASVGGRDGGVIRALGSSAGDAGFFHGHLSKEHTA